LEHVNKNTVSGQKLRLSRVLPRFESQQQARERKAKLVKDLRAGKRATRRVGRRLRRCRKDAWCGSPICPRCVRGLRKSFIPGAMGCIRQVCANEGIPEEQMVAFSAILTEERYAEGELCKANLRQINERLQRRHQRAGLPLVFTGVDISYNEDSEGRWEPHWQLQVYGVCVGVDVAEVTTRLAKLHPANNTTPKPLRVRRCKKKRRNLAKALSYMIKPYFGRRVSYLDDDTGRFNTRKVTLKRAQAQELATWIDQYPLTARYALTGCRRYGDRIEPTPRNSV
jgi:hypothetical protein